jgi:uncharacterized protein YxjI
MPQKKKDDMKIILDEMRTIKNELSNVKTELCKLKNAFDIQENSNYVVKVRKIVQDD